MALRERWKLKGIGTAVLVTAQEQKAVFRRLVLSAREEAM